MYIRVGHRNLSNRHKVQVQVLAKVAAEVVVTQAQVLSVALMRVHLMDR